MTEDPRLAQQIAIERLQPAGSEDQLRRALFYCHCLHQYSKRTLELLIIRCDNGEFGPLVQEQVPLLSASQLESCYKLLTCISLHMTGLDNSLDSASDWLLEFFSAAAGETDELFESPTAMSIIQKHGSWKRDKMIHDAATDVCQILNFSEDNESFHQQLEQFLVETASYRSELLLFALSQPIEALRRHLDSLDR